MTATSPGPGKGSTFVVRLLLEPADERPSTPGREAAGETPGTRVLIVDDNADAAEMLGAGLRIHGHEVTVALTAAEALRVGAGFQFWVALLDLVFPASTASRWSSGSAQRLGGRAPCSSRSPGAVCPKTAHEPPPPGSPSTS